MSDPRFFEKSGPFSLIEIANLINGDLSCENDGILIEDISTLKIAKDNEITFFQDLSYKSDLGKTKAAVCLIKKEHKDYAPENIDLIFSSNPYMDFTLISQSFYPNEIFPKSTSSFEKSLLNNGVDHTAVIDPT